MKVHIQSRTRPLLCRCFLMLPDAPLPPCLLLFQPYLSKCLHVYQGPGGYGYGKIDSFNTEMFTVHTDAKPTNFERCCVFEVLSLESDAESGAVIRYGSAIAFRHKLTGKMLARQVGGVGLQNHSVVLRDGVDEQSSFSPAPRIKLHAEGNPVKYDASIIVETAQGGSSKRRLHFPANSSSNELVASHARSSIVRFRLFAPYDPDSLRHPNTLRGGDFVRLCHQENDALLAAVRQDFRMEGGFVSSKRRNSRPAFVSAAGSVCLKSCKPADKRAQAPQHNDTRSMWAVEVDDIYDGGRRIKWGEAVRLKSVLFDGCVMSNFPRTHAPIQRQQRQHHRTLIYLLTLHAFTPSRCIHPSFTLHCTALHCTPLPPSIPLHFHVT